jgi:pyruvate/2-oxoglutarate dehydrogenase complex dihydrolipoamide acyltransferase (E2) component
VGDEVAPEKVICIIEAMKVMNEIKAEMQGIVREILVKKTLMGQKSYPTGGAGTGGRGAADPAGRRQKQARQRP